MMLNRSAESGHLYLVPGNNFFLMKFNLDGKFLESILNEKQTPRERKQKQKHDTL